jgi:hypothetical protein
VCSPADRRPHLCDLRIFSRGGCLPRVTRRPRKTCTTLMFSPAAVLYVTSVRHARLKLSLRGAEASAGRGRALMLKFWSMERAGLGRRSCD